VTFWQRVRQAAADGLIFAVKWTVALGAVLFLLLWALKDYNIVRQRAANGQAAYEFIQKAQEQAQKAQQPAKP
jgi:hypothetical protein